MEVQFSSYTKNLEQEHKFFSTTPIQTEFQFFVQSQIQNFICNTKFEKNQSVKQNFFGNYSRFVRSNNKCKL